MNETRKSVVRNNTAVDQCFGRYIIPANSFGELPFDIAESLIRNPIKELTVLQEELGSAVFVRTEHEPTSIRYQERKCLSTIPPS